MMMLPCPKCHAAMETITVHDLEIERCTVCGGMWFDLLEHRRLRDVAGAADQLETGRVATADTNALLASCPRCHVRLTRLRDVDERAVQYDYCSICHGTFFDAGEFRKYAGDGFVAWLRSRCPSKRSA